MNLYLEHHYKRTGSIINLTSMTMNNFSRRNRNLVSYTASSFGGYEPKHEYGKMNLLMGTENYAQWHEATMQELSKKRLTVFALKSKENLKMKEIVESDESTDEEMPEFKDMKITAIEIPTISFINEVAEPDNMKRELLNIEIQIKNQKIQRENEMEREKASYHNNIIDQRTAVKVRNREKKRRNRLEKGEIRFAQKNNEAAAIICSSISNHILSALSHETKAIVCKAPLSHPFSRHKNAHKIKTSHLYFLKLFLIVQEYCQTD